jgi:cytochrome c oxidase subunit 2
VDPTKLAETAPFNEPGVVEVGPSQYEARIIAGVWFFTPNEIRVPAGSTVTFIATSRDIIHGFSLHDAHVNMMLLPGRIARATARFERPGEHLFLCHEYCGIAHHTMFGKVVVEARP